MSYGYGKRSDPPTRLVPADEPVNRVRAPAGSDSRKGQRTAAQGHIGDVSAGLVRSELSDFLIDLDEALLTVKDRQDPAVTRVRLGRLGDLATDYGIEIYLSDGSPLFAAGGLAEDSVGAEHLRANSVAAEHLQAIHVEVAKFIRSSNFLTGSDGWAIDGGGNAEFNDVTVRGVLDGATGTYEGNLVAAGGTFAGNLSAAGGTFSGSLSAASGTFTGTLSAVGGTFSTITAGLLFGQEILLDLDATGTASVLEGTNFVIRANGSIVLGSHFAVDTLGNVTFSGELTAATGTFSGELTAATGTFSGDLTASVVLSNRMRVKGPYFLDTNNRPWLELDGNKIIQDPPGAFMRLTTRSGTEFSGTIQNTTIYSQRLIRADGEFVIETTSGDVRLDPTGDLDFLLATDTVAGSAEGYIVVKINGALKKIPYHAFAA